MSQDSCLTRLKNSFAKKTRTIVEREGKMEPFSLFLEVFMLERNFQSGLIKEIKKRLDGCFVLKTDPNYIQGLPDLLILYNNKWAALEVKRSENAHHQPNQDFYISTMSKMSFASFISPETKKEVLNALCKALQS